DSLSTEASAPPRRTISPAALVPGPPIRHPRRAVARGHRPGRQVHDAFVVGLLPRPLAPASRSPILYKGSYSRKRDIAKWNAERNLGRITSCWRLFGPVTPFDFLSTSFILTIRGINCGIDGSRGSGGGFRGNRRASLPFVSLRWNALLRRGRHRRDK